MEKGRIEFSILLHWTPIDTNKSGMRASGLIPVIPLQH